jgi:murein DD-endopeptidase MepM/ murein hydrolase activator NlpD
MKRIFSVAAAVFARPHRRVLFCVLLFSAAAALSAENLYHIVKNGDTVYSLARQYKVKEAELLSANGIADARKIYVGQKLRIPTDAATGGAPAAEGLVVEYRAVQGDTLYGIARKHGISYQELAAVNNFSPAYVLKAGNMVKVPLPHAGGVPPERKSFSSSPPPAVKAPPKPPPARVEPAAPAKALPLIEWPVVPKASQSMTGKLNGLVLTGEKTESVRSLTAGIVVSAGPYRGYGRVVIVKSDGGYEYVYAGCESLTVKQWDRVVPGSEVGRLGVDPHTSKPQLFFMVYRNGKPVDPAKIPHA